jgi:hypothetical protein
MNKNLDNPLQNLFFGKDDAESDSSQGGLLKQGFLQTAAYEAALKGRKQLIIGRKGSGKSAICLMLKARSGNGACVSLVTPDEISGDEIRRFELSGITPEQSKVLVWRYVFVVQIAKYVLYLAKHYLGTESNCPNEIVAVRRFLIDNGEVDDLTIHEKFWRVLERIKLSISLDAFGANATAEIAPSQGIRANTQLDEIEKQLQKALNTLPKDNNRPRLLLLVDQLEKVWTNDRNSDLMVVGLLLASKHISGVFTSDIYPIIFLRLDIYDLLQFQNRDFFRTEEMHIAWDKEALLDLALTRAQASIGLDISSDDLWRNIFPSKVNGKKIEDFIIQHTLMRPREVIQLCNACVDSANANGHNKISENDVIEALRLYSNWKVSDLVSEYQINYPFLSRLFVLFTNTSFLISRQVLEQKLSKISDSLTNQYREYANIFSIDGILSILYGIGFLGVMRRNQATYNHIDSRTIEYYEAQFIIHPAFREALRSTSCIDLIPYQPGLLEANITQVFNEFNTESSARRSAVRHSRGNRSFRFVGYIQEICERIEIVAAKTNLPDEVRDEIRRNLKVIRADADRIRYEENEMDIYEFSNRILRFFTNLESRISENQFFEEVKNKELKYAISSALSELNKGLTYGEYLE